MPVMQLLAAWQRGLQRQKLPVKPFSLLQLQLAFKIVRDNFSSIDK